MTPVPRRRFVSRRATETDLGLNQSPSFARLVFVLAGVIQDHEFPKFPRIILSQETFDQLPQSIGPQVGAAECGKFHSSALPIPPFRFLIRSTAFCHVGDISVPCMTCDFAMW